MRITRSLAIWLAIGGSVRAQQDQVHQRFEKLDANDDGKLSAEEVPWERWFGHADADGDGSVTREEADRLGGGR